MYMCLLLYQLFCFQFPVDAPLDRVFLPDTYAILFTSRGFALLLLYLRVTMECGGCLLCPVLPVGTSIP